MSNKICAFCHLPESRVIDSCQYGLVVRDGFPISPGHTLIIPKRHIASFFETTPDERNELLTLLDRAKENLITEFSPDGFNIGINDGLSAGQTIPHLHIHLIPRYLGDLTDPRGGVRWIIPEKAKYWP
ncbi:MAG: HIT family protein [Comamonadaceae bacterium PBBC2]|nr:MAG: HIT family protein [Comamonadaceae bacterium PBBC2]